MFYCVVTVCNVGYVKFGYLNALLEYFAMQALIYINRIFYYNVFPYNYAKYSIREYSSDFSPNVLTLYDIIHLPIILIILLG